MKKQLPAICSLHSLLKTKNIVPALLICFFMQAPGNAVASNCNPPTYCIPQGTTNIFGNGYVTEFKITDSVNTVLIDQVAADQSSCCNYIDNTGVGTPNLKEGSTYTFSGSRQDDGEFLGMPDPFNYGMNIWIDYNDDGTFNNTGTNVEVVYREGLSEVDAFSFTYTIPVTGITTGVHRLRIRTHYNDPNPDPCANYGSNGAQGMDFLVNILCNGTGPTASAGSKVTVCTGATVNLTSNATAGNTPYSFSWCGPNSFISGQQDTSITNVVLADSGTYIVTAADANGCVSTASMAVAISTAPTEGASNSSPVCSGGTLYLSTGGGATYSWTGPNSYSSTLQYPIIAGIPQADSGVYTVVITAAGGCTASATTTVIISNTLDATASSGGTSCYGDSIQLFADGGTSYAWIGPNSFYSPMQNPVIQFALPADTGIYTVTVTGAGGCTATATTDAGIYAPVTAPSINQFGDTLKCSDTTFTTYQWYSDTTLIPGATHSYLIVSQNGNYNIEVANANGCSVAVGINVTLTGIPVVEGTDNVISLMPDPAGSQLTLTLSPPQKEGTVVSIINMIGQEALPPAFLERNETSAVIYVGNLAPGIYFVQLKSENGMLLKKFIKE